MSIWIRSQDGKYLGNVNFAWVSGGIVFGCSRHQKGASAAGIGNYISEAEAIQVLDRLQERICKITTSNICENPVVFQMPEAGFSTKTEKFHPDCSGDFCGFIDPAKADEITPYNHCSQIGTCKAAWNRGCR